MCSLRRVLPFTRIGQPLFSRPEPCMLKLRPLRSTNNHTYDESMVCEGIQFGSPQDRTWYDQSTRSTWHGSQTDRTAGTLPDSAVKVYISSSLSFFHLHNFFLFMKCENETLNKLWGTFQSLPFLFVAPCFLINCPEFTFACSRVRFGERATDFGLSTSSHFPPFLTPSPQRRSAPLVVQWACVAPTETAHRIYTPRKNDGSLGFWPLLRPTEIHSKMENVQREATTDFYKLLDSDICDPLISRSSSIPLQCWYRAWQWWVNEFFCEIVIRSSDELEMVPERCVLEK